ncbi:MAG: hypothetical protein ACOZFS_05935 [Thermodesulfobacteriota bacterium]
MSRDDELWAVKRSIERQLREAGLSVKAAKIAIAIFSRYLDRGDRRSCLGKILSRLKGNTENPMCAP